MSEVQPDVTAIETEVSTEVKNIIEALIFASDEPMSVRFIRSVVDEANKSLQPHEQIFINAEIIRKAVTELNRAYNKIDSAFRIKEIGGGFVHATQEQFAAWVGKLAKEKARRRLSPTAIETLAIIAYKQPITKAEVEFIRGVNADYIINALLEKDLISITGRQNSPGRPLLYGTTQKFLEHFGLNDLIDLPKPREIAELINETEAEVDRRLLAEQQELEFREDLEQKLEGHEGAKQTAKVSDTEKPLKGRSKKSALRIKEERESDFDKEKSNQKTEDAEIQETVAEIQEAASNQIANEDDKKEIKNGLNKDVRPDEIERSITETVAPLEKERKNIYEGEALSAQQVEIRAETQHKEADGSTKEEAQIDRETGWSKWKIKVKSFFKKLFG